MLMIGLKDVKIPYFRAHIGSINAINSNKSYFPVFKFMGFGCIIDKFRDL